MRRLFLAIAFAAIVALAGTPAAEAATHKLSVQHQASSHRLLVASKDKKKSEKKKKAKKKKTAEYTHSAA